MEIREGKTMGEKKKVGRMVEVVIRTRSRKQGLVGLLSAGDDGGLTSLHKG